MALTPGSRVGPYEVVAPLGAGGMGEVYRARDSKLGRDVAVKVLPDALAQNPERMARFEREAKVLAALNHPNIATIYGLEDRAIVMELVEGATLMERLASGPLPLEEAMGIARQVAEALEAAHEKGIIHRDLKPANIKITPEGTVKVLDFGLATALQAGERDSVDATNSPTLTMAATEIGVILGTASYMSPEQASGKRVDKRADVWSFGVVLWEMLSGRQLFGGGETVSHTLADVLRAEIRPEQVQAPAAIRDLLGRCLDRDVKTRLRDIGEARVAITRYLANPGAAAEKPSAQVQARATSKLPWIAAGLCAAAAIAIGAWAWLHRPEPDTRAFRYPIDPPPGTRFTNIFFSGAVSPDGRLLVFGAAKTNGTASMLWLRPLDSLEARELPGTDGGNGMFWSPDSKSVGFNANGKLKRVDIVGGSPQVLCDTPNFDGGTWGPDGTILFSASGVIQQVAAAGGSPSPVTSLDASRQERAHRHPYFLPGRKFLFTITSGLADEQGIYQVSLDAPKKRVRLANSWAKAVYAPPRDGYPGYVLWIRDETLVAQRFDEQGRPQGDATPVVDQVLGRETNNGRAAFWISDNGTLVYRSGGSAANQFHWVSRGGQREVVKVAVPVGNPQPFDPRMAPDDSRVAFDLGSNTGAGVRDIWVYEFARGVLTRVTTGPGSNDFPVWSPDGRRFVFRSNREGTAQIYRKDAAGTGVDERLTTGPNPKAPLDWSRDGRYLLYEEADPKTGVDIWALPLGGAEQKPIPLLRTPFNETDAQFSPDGKWIVYASNESGSPQVYIQSFPPSTGKWQVSTTRGEQPKWSADGKEVYFYSGVGDGNIAAAPIRTAGGRVEIDPPRDLPVHYSRYSSIIHYDVTHDGQHVLMVQPPFSLNDATASLIVLSNWQATLRR